MIRLTQVEIRAGEFALRGLNLELPAGAYGTLMGPTGCGKTTLLETICGLRNLWSGRIEIAGRDVTHVRAAMRGIGYVPQDGALFSHLTVRDNLGFALRLRRWPRRRLSDRTGELADVLSIGHLLDRFPEKLSGGERQRVALGRALAFQPEVMLLDEPLSALDAETRLPIQELLKRLQRHERVTVLHVTHQADEAERLADHRWRFSNGRLVREPAQTAGESAAALVAPSSFPSP